MRTALLIIFFALNGWQKAVSDDKIVIKANSLVNMSGENKVSASGNVKFIKNNYTISSEKIVFDKKEKKISFDGKTKLTDIENNNIFAESGEVSDDVAEGVFNNAGIILNNGISIISPAIKKKENIYFIKKCSFYFCKNDDLNINLPYDKIKKEIGKMNKQPITLYSLKSNLDKDKEKIYFKNVFVRLFNIPILYLPYFSTSAGFKKNVSGLSSPKILNDRNYGFGLEATLNLYLFDDALLLKTTPTFYTRHDNLLLDNRIDYGGNDFFYTLNYMAAFDNGASKNIKDSNDVSEINSGVYREYRDYLNLKAKQKFNDKFFYFSDFYNINDEYFPRDYMDNYDEYLNSNFTIFKGFFDYDFLKINGLKTAVIREGKDRKELDNPNEVLNVEYFYNKKLYEGDNGGYLSLNVDSNLNNVFDDDRNEFDRLSTNININYSDLINDLLLDFNIDLYHDKYLYFIDKNYSNSDQNRTVIDFNLNLNYNLSFDYITIQPILQYYYNNSSKSGIFTDKDSKSSALNITNIFSANRYNGYDLFEYGSRVNYGLELSTSMGNYGFEFMVAQGYKSDVNKDYPIENFEDNFSDILNGFNIVNTDNSVSFSFLSILNRGDFSMKRRDFVLNLLHKKFELESDYAFLNSKHGVTEEQLSFTTRYKLNRTLKIGLEMNNDLERKRVTSVKTNLIFEENCVRFELSAKQHNYEDSNGQNNWSLNASLRIKN